MAFLSYRFRLYPTPAQERALSGHLMTLCHVYNTALQYWIDLYREEKRIPSSGEVYSLFSAIRNFQKADKKSGGDGPHYLSSVSAIMVRDTVERVRESFQGFFRRVRARESKVGYPRFKSYRRFRSIPIGNYGAGACVIRDCEGNKMVADIPSSRGRYRADIYGVGLVRVLVHRHVTGTVKMATIRRDTDGKWYVVLVAQMDREPVIASSQLACGVDLGLASFLVTSNGERVVNPRFSASHASGVRVIKRAICRKALAAKSRGVKFKDCRNGQRDVARLRKLGVRIRNLRREHRYKTAHWLVGKYGTICVEDLTLEGMHKSRGMSREIGDVGWIGFIRVLVHKAEKAGVRVVKVEPRYTSQTCSRCGFCDARNRKSQSDFVCVSCGHVENADVNAAKNILTRGLENEGGRSSVGDNLDTSSDCLRTPHLAKSHVEGPCDSFTRNAHDSDS